ncbi:glycosyl transferase family 90 [Vannielia litorea]|uniref:Glycosyl transferase family 90 n=1 Tax=Vannielia litorea TaxID=1217970 RepID=A0A1N6DZF3_9RHOB|nr:glycosyl transferase family 90 [Vannielia litorea]SIN76148.1 Glycosyl transferase family 90 [Vannielia litorea]
MFRQPKRGSEAGFWGGLKRRRRLGQARSESARQIADLAKLPPLTVGRSDRPSGAYDVRIRREGAGYRVLLPSFRADANARSYVRRRTAAYLWWFMQAAPEVEEISGNTSDGETPSLARYSFSSYGSQVPLPDYYFFRDRGYEAFRRQALSAEQDWDSRSDALIWRGGPNGLGLVSTDPAMARHPGLQQRIALALRCKGGPIDVGFVAASSPDQAAIFEAAGILGDVVPNLSWGGRKYAIDIDGFSNAWDNLFHRLLLGCCVLKVESPFGFRQWYYDRLQPGCHYVPVRADLSDLETQFDWVKANPSQAREIAAEGQALARSLTWDSECARAGEIINSTWSSQ